MWSPVIMRKLDPSSLHSWNRTSRNRVPASTTPDIRQLRKSTRFSTASCSTAPESSHSSKVQSATRNRSARAPVKRAPANRDSITSMEPKVAPLKSSVTSPPASSRSLTRRRGSGPAGRRRRTAGARARHRCGPRPARDRRSSRWSSPRSINSRRRAAHSAGGPRMAKRSANSSVRTEVCAAPVRVCDFMSYAACTLVSTSCCASLTGPVGVPCITENRANDARPPDARARAVSRSGWATTFTYAPIDGMSPPRSSRTTSRAHATRAGSAPTAKVTRSASRAAMRSTRWAGGGDRHRHLRPGQADPLDPAGDRRSGQAKGVERRRDAAEGRAASSNATSSPRR